MKEMKVLSTYFITGKLLCASSLLYYIFICFLLKDLSRSAYSVPKHGQDAVAILFVGSGAAESALV
jgi:hypothetical protein